MHFLSAITTILILKYASGFRLMYNFNEHLMQTVGNVEYNLSQVTEEWIEQPLDQFGGHEIRWRMRYFKNLEMWRPNGPIFIFINGEWTAGPESIQSESTLIRSLAKEMNGAVFSSEHRFYGKSVPVSPVTVHSLQFLSSQQALADLANLIRFIKSAPEFRASKVVVVGGSYSGSLAAWARLLYPDLVDAAVASSGPVLAKKDFYEYLETVRDDFEQYGTPGCLDRIRATFANYAELLKTPYGIDQLKKQYNICPKTDMSVTENQNFFFQECVVRFEGAAQYGSPGVIKSLCESLTNMQPLIPLQNGQDCNDFDFNNNVDDYRHLRTETYYWTYQYCTEFGYLQTTTSERQPFGNHIPVELSVKLCKGVFGEEFDERRMDAGVARTNALYGGKTPAVTNVVFTHGAMDPWKQLGVLADLSETAPAIVTPGTTHCGILFESPYEPTELTQDRERVKSLIKKWIA